MQNLDAVAEIAQDDMPANAVAGMPYKLTKYLAIMSCITKLGDCICHTLEINEMKPVLARMALLVVIILLVRTYSPFGEGSFALEFLNIGVYVLAFAIGDRLITATLRKRF